MTAKLYPSFILSREESRRHISAKRIAGKMLATPSGLLADPIVTTAYLEEVVLGWLISLFGLPPTSGWGIGHRIVPSKRFIVAESPDPAFHDRDKLESRTCSRRSAWTRSAVPKAPRIRIVYGCNEATYADRSTMSSSVSFITTGFIVIAFFPSRVPLLKS